MSSKRIFSALFVVGLFCFSVYAQEGSISGTVTNGLTGGSLYGALVTCVRTTGGIIDSILTDSAGSYGFDSLETSGGGGVRYDVTASMAGFVSESQEVRLTSNSPNETADFDLGIRPVLIPIQSPTTNAKPTFLWYLVAGATTYTIQIDTTNTFTNPVISTPVNDTTYTPLIDLPIATIYWRVSAVPDLYSEISSFVITDPNTPVLIPYSPDPTQERRPILQWYSVAGASSYHILIDDNGDFSSVLISTPLADTVYTPLVDLPVGAIYWKVKSDLSDVYSVPDTFTILSDTIPLLYTFDGATVNNRRPVFKWKPVTGATSYTINIDTNSAFVSPVISTPVGDTTYTPLVDLGIDKYFWRVSSNLSPALFSMTDSLVIDTITPVIVPLTNHFNNTNLFIYPNPFINTTKICYTLPKTTNVTMAIFNMDGRLVRTLSGKNTAGQHCVIWDGMDNNGRKAGPGVYLLRLSAGKVLNRKLMLIR